MKKLLCALLIICLMTACAPAEAPQRVAVLFSSFAQMWVEAGGTIDITVGESVERGFADEGVILVDDGAGKTINTELLLASRPDLVILSNDIAAQADTALLLKDAGIDCLALSVENFEDYAAAFKTMTDLTGNAAAYEKYVTEARAKIEALTAENRFDGLTYAFIRTGSTASSTKIKQSSEHFACDIISAFGLNNIADAGSSASGAVNTEALLAADPDWLFFSIMGDEEAGTAYINELLAQPEWQALTAVREGKVLILPKALFHFKPNSRWADAYQYIADTLNGIKAE